MANTTKDTPEPTPLPAEASQPGRSLFERLDAWASPHWEAGKKESSLIWNFIKAYAYLPVVITPLLALTGIAAHVGYAEKFGLAAGSMEFSISQILWWGWLSWFVQLGSLVRVIILLSVLLIMFPVVMGFSMETSWLQRLTRIPMSFIALLLVIVLPAQMGFTEGKTLAKDMVNKADYSVRFVIPPTLEPSFDPTFLACNRIKGDLRKVWASKEEVVVYSISQQKSFEVFMKDIQNAVVEPIKIVNQAHKL